MVGYFRVYLSAVAAMKAYDHFEQAWFLLDNTLAKLSVDVTP
jgi:hypothetical protein